MSGKKIIFVGGNARSGTTALQNLLNCHPSVFVLRERYLAEVKAGQLHPSMFDKSAVLAEEAGIPLPLLQSGVDLGARYDQALYVGDKVPAVSKGFDAIDRVFPDAVIVFILRNPFSVAASYQQRFDRGTWKRDAVRGIQDWNRSTRSALRRVQTGGRLIVVPYEEVFQYGDKSRQLFAALGLDPSELDQDAFDVLVDQSQRLETKSETRSEELLAYVARNAAFQPYRQLLSEHSLYAEQPN